MCPGAGKATPSTAEAKQDFAQLLTAKFFLAKSVAAFANWGLQEKFMLQFNSRKFSCYTFENTKVPENLVEGLQPLSNLYIDILMLLLGRVSLRGHHEIKNNPLFATPEGKAGLTRLQGRIRDVIVEEVDAIFKSLVAQGVYGSLSPEDLSIVKKAVRTFDCLANAGESVSDVLPWDLSLAKPDDQVSFNSYCFGKD